MVRLRAVWVGVVVRCMALCGRALHAAAGLVVLWGGFGGWYCGVLCGRRSAVPRGMVGRYAVVGGLWCRGGR